MEAQIINKTFDYKQTIRELVKLKRQRQPSFSLRRLAQLIPIQYTYLSKVLNDDKAHLNEDHCFRIAQLLDLDLPQTEIFLLKRSLAGCSDSQRRAFLTAQLEKKLNTHELEAKKIETHEHELKNEIALLLDPHCVLVRAALGIDKYRKKPTLICHQLKISEEELRTILLRIEAAGEVELSQEDPFKILNYQPFHRHFDKNHPLAQSYTLLQKSLIPAQLQRCSDREKKYFVATVSMTERDFEDVKKEFQIFIKKVEKIVLQARREAVYQLNFDLLKIL